MSNSKPELNGTAFGPNWRQTKLATKKMGRKYRLPRIETTFPIKRNPIQETIKEVPEYQRMLDVVFETSGMSAENFYKIHDVSEFIAHMHPCPMDMESYINLIRVNQYFFVIDDHEECFWGDGARRKNESREIWAQFLSCLDLVVDKKAEVAIHPVWWKTYISGYFWAINELCNHWYNQDQRVRLCQAYRDYALANMEEHQNIQSGRRIRNLEEYFRIRIDTIGFKVVIQQNEYAYGISLTNEEWEDSLMTKYLDLGAITITLPNDIVSFEKELIENKGDASRLFNCVAVVMHLEGLDVEQGMQRTYEIFQEYEKKTKEVQGQLLERTDNSEAVKTFIMAVEATIGGCTAAHLTIFRYNNVFELKE